MDGKTMCANCDELQNMTAAAAGVFTALDPTALAKSAAFAVDRDKLTEGQEWEMAILMHLLGINDTLMNVCLRNGDIDAAMMHSALILSLSTRFGSFPQKA